MPEVYTFQRDGRSTKGAVIVLVIWLVLAALWLLLDAAWWIVGAVWLFTLPAVSDLIRNPSSGLKLTESTLRWYTGPRDAEVALPEIDHMRLDTRLDFSVRASVVLRSGRKIRLPFESTPPHQAFEAALLAQGLKVQRHHYQLFQ